MDFETRKELLSFAEFERFLEEEASLSEEYGLPLTVMALSREAGWDEDSTRRVLGVLRLAEPAALLESGALVSFLPNTGLEGSKAVARRVKEVMEEVSVGLALRLPDDEVRAMISHAEKEAAEPANQSFP